MADAVATGADSVRHTGGGSGRGVLGSSGVAVTTTAQIAADSALAATYARPKAADSICLLGDSLTAANLTGAYGWAQRGPWTWAQVLMGHRLKVLNVGGVSGETSTQVLARLQTDVLAYNPGWCLVEAGTNDVKANATAATIQANLTSMFTQMKAAGIRVVVLNIMPWTGWTSGQQSTVFAVNQWLQAYVQANQGVWLVDQHSLCADPSTGAPATGMTYDGTHYTNLLAAAVGQRIYQVMNGLTYPIDLLPSSPLEPGILSANPMMAGNTSGLATGWTLQRTNFGAFTGTKSKVTRIDGITGEWQQISLDVNAIDAMLYQQITTGFATGDKVKAHIEFQTDNDWASVTRFRARCFFRDSGNAQLTDIGSDLSQTDINFPLAYRPASGVLETIPITVPANAAKVEINVDFIGTGTFRIGRAAIRKVT